MHTPGQLPAVFEGARTIEPPLSASVVTLGTFDGVHRGHQELVARAVAVARVRGVEPVAYTFDPHPAKVLVPHAAPKTIISTRERVRLLRAHGISRVVVEPFDPSFAALDADTWVMRFLAERLQPSHVVVGFNFTYGRARGGGPEHLIRSGEHLGFTVDVVGAVGDGELAVSSTRVRERLHAGDVEGAAELLGHAPALTGIVVEGDKRGRTIGFPTANLAAEAELVPLNGVYATRVVVEPSDAPDAPPEPALPGITNIGTRPTFDGTRTSIETHVLDFAGDLYGRRLRVELVGRIREERKFSGIDALVAQVRTDVEAARALLARGA